MGLNWRILLCTHLSKDVSNYYEMISETTWRLSPYPPDFRRSSDHLAHYQSEEYLSCWMIIQVGLFMLTLEPQIRWRILSTWSTLSFYFFYFLFGGGPRSNIGIRLKDDWIRPTHLRCKGNHNCDMSFIFSTYNVDVLSSLNLSCFFSSNRHQIVR